MPWFRLHTTLFLKTLFTYFDNLIRLFDAIYYMSTLYDYLELFDPKTMEYFSFPKRPCNSSILFESPKSFNDEDNRVRIHS